MEIYDLKNETNDNPISVFAFHLPQFHPIPENDEWWGKGFTEWTNTAKAKPLFRGHYQPRVPADLGFYDLRVPETRAQQAEMAQAHGIDAFCYYHYWFAGRQILERPLKEIVASGEPDFPFLICWANQTWSGIWHGAPNSILIEQTYPGEEDHRRHFEELLPVFEDKRYFRHNGKPIFVIYRPKEIPEVKKTLDFWRKLAVRAGLGGLHIIGVRDYSDDISVEDLGLDACTANNLPPLRPGGRISKPQTLKPRQWIRTKCQMALGRPTIYNYDEAIREMLMDAQTGEEYYPVVIPNWDNTPRSGVRGKVLHNWSLDLWRDHATRGLEVASKAAKPDRILFVKSWNEWAEGNHLEPDLKYGLAPLEVLRDAKKAIIDIMKSKG